MLDLVFRRLIAVVQIYGGAAGIVLGVGGLPGGRHSAPELVVTLLFLALFAWGLVAGVRLLERSGGVRASMWFQALQIPSLLSPVLAYEFVAGVEITLHLSRTVGLGYGVDANWQFALFPRNQVWSLGVNLLPLFAALYLRFSLRR